MTRRRCDGRGRLGVRLAVFLAAGATQGVGEARRVLDSDEAKEVSPKLNERPSRVEKGY